MSVISRATATMARAARQSEEALNRTMDRKDKELEASKRVNEFITMVDDLRSQDTINDSDVDALTAFAVANDISLPQLQLFRASLERNDNGQIEIKTEDGEKNTDNLEKIDGLVKKAERYLETQQGATGQTDLRLKMQLNDVTQYLQDGNSMVQIDKDNKGNTAIRA